MNKSYKIKIIKKFIFGVFFVSCVFILSEYVLASSLPEFIIDIGNTKCPVLEQPVKDDYVAVFEGKLYHFCCEGCVKKFLEKPFDYISKINNTDYKEKKLKVTNKDGKCPITGKDINLEYFFIKEDEITFFSSNDAKSKALANAAKPELSNNKTQKNQLESDAENKSADIKMDVDLEHKKEIEKDNSHQEESSDCGSIKKSSCGACTGCE